MAFKVKTGSLLHAVDPGKSGSLIGSIFRHGRNVVEGVISWGGRKGAEVKSFKWRFGGATAEVFAPVARSSAPAISIACRTQKPAIVVQNLFNAFILRSHPESLVSKYAAKITPPLYWSFLRSPEQFRTLGRRLAMYSFVGLSFAANCQGPEFAVKDHEMDISKVCGDIRKMFSDRLVYGASCASVERMEQAKLGDYEMGQLIMTNGHTACFEAKINPSTSCLPNYKSMDESCSFEVHTACESDTSVIFEEEKGDILMSTDVAEVEREADQVRAEVESEIEHAGEIINSQQKQLHDTYKVLCGQNEKLSSLANQFVVSDDDEDCDSASSIEVINWWEESFNGHLEQSFNGWGFVDDMDADDYDSVFSLDDEMQLYQALAAAKKQEMELIELQAVLRDQNRRIQALTSSCQLANDFNLIIKVRWMTDCSLEYAAGVLMSELLPAHEYCCVNQEWSRSGWRIPSHFNVAPVMGGFLTSVQELKIVPACRDALPCVSSWQQDIAVCVVTSRYELTLAEFLASHEPGITEAMLMFLQLVEAVVHMGSHKICHRDLKSENIFIEQLDDGPRLLVANFGSGLHIATKYGFFVSCDVNDARRCSWSYLLAPEYFASSSPKHEAFMKADLWTCGAIAYEMFGAANPFRLTCNGKRLTSSSYHENDLPDLPGSVPSYVGRLVRLMLKTDPNMRPDPELIADTLHLSMWAPQHWKQSVPSRLEINRWITQFAAETYLLSSPHNVQRPTDREFGEFSVVNALKVQFLSRVNPSSVNEAAHLLFDISNRCN